MGIHPTRSHSYNLDRPQKELKQKIGMRLRVNRMFDRLSVYFEPKYNEAHLDTHENYTKYVNIPMAIT